jgi:outer membrane protein assembly factor BamE (lipoprotein component of BamABCDE complex)
MRHTIKSRFIAALAVAAAGLLVACVTVGRDFPAQNVAKLQIGTTTQEQVKALFGTPWRTGSEDGQLTWTYGHYRYALLGTTHTRDLVVRFDARDVVASYTFNSTNPDDAPR